MPSEYIERDALIAHLKKDPLFSLVERYGIVGVLEAFPAADVRPVVLCRDCVHFQQFRPHDGFCKIDGMLWNNDFFCANGMRKES